MSEEFPIKIQLGKPLRLFFYSQLFRTPSYPSQSFAGQTVIVTGANSGLGFEAARHFYRLNCAKLILAVRTISKGQTAKEEIVQSIKHRTSDGSAIEVWPLDLASTESVLAFSARVQELPRVDVVVESAGINSKTRSTSEGFEQTIQVNVLNTFLLAMSLLPKLRETKSRFADSAPHLVIVTSEAHQLNEFKEINAPDLYKGLNEREYDGQKMYEISKLMEILLVRELVSRLHDAKPSAPPVVIDLVNPGLCKSELSRDAKGVGSSIVSSLILSILGRSTEVGSRTLVLGACAGPLSHGEYMSDGENQNVADWIYGDVGKRVQKKVFEQTIKVLETRKPGLAKEVGL